MMKTALSKTGTVKKKSPAAGAFSYLLHFSTLWEFRSYRESFLFQELVEGPSDGLL